MLADGNNLYSEKCYPKHTLQKFYSTQPLIHWTWKWLLQREFVSRVPSAIMWVIINLLRWTLPFLKSWHSIMVFSSYKNHSKISQTYICNFLRKVLDGKSAVFMKLLRHYDKRFSVSGRNLVNIACGNFVRIIVIWFAPFKVHESFSPRHYRRWGGFVSTQEKKKSPWVLDKLRAQTTHSDQVGDKVVPNFPD